MDKAGQCCKRREGKEWVRLKPGFPWGRGGAGEAEPQQQAGPRHRAARGARGRRQEETGLSGFADFSLSQYFMNLSFKKLGYEGS